MQLKYSVSCKREKTPVSKKNIRWKQICWLHVSIIRVSIQYAWHRKYWSIYVGIIKVHMGVYPWRDAVGPNFSLSDYCMKLLYAVCGNTMRNVTNWLFSTFEHPYSRPKAFLVCGHWLTFSESWNLLTHVWRKLSLSTSSCRLPSNPLALQVNPH